MKFNLKILQYSILQILVFFYLYPTLFKFVPGVISTRILIGIIGFIFFFVTQYKAVFNPESYKLKKDKIILLVFLLIIPLYTLFSIYINQTSDFAFIIHSFSILLIYFAYLFLKIFSNSIVKNIDLFFVSNLIINSILIQLCIALLMYIIPAFSSFINNIQVIDDADLDRISKILEFRLVGLGTKFFGAGILNAFALILVAYNIREKTLNYISILKYTLVFIFILLVGMMMSRTTLIGGLIGLLIIITPINKSNGFVFNNTLKFLISLFTIPIILALIIIIFVPSVSKQFQTLFNFGFEIFINYFETGSATSESTEDLKTMYILPTDLKTYIIGDGKFNEVGGSYYMGTDVSYLRLLFYLGIPGLILFLSFQLYFIKISFSKNKLLIFSISFLFLLLSFKGFTDIFFVVLLFNLININKPQIA